MKNLDKCSYHRTLLEHKLLKQKGFFVVPSMLKPEPTHFIIRIFNSEQKLKKLKKFGNLFFSFEGRYFLKMQEIFCRCKFKIIQ